MLLEICFRLETIEDFHWSLCQEPQAGLADNIINIDKSSMARTSRLAWQTMGTSTLFPMRSMQCEIWRHFSSFRCCDIPILTSAMAEVCLSEYHCHYLSSFSKLSLPTITSPFQFLIFLKWVATMELPLHSV